MEHDPFQFISIDEKKLILEFAWQKIQENQSYIEMFSQTTLDLIFEGSCGDFK